MVEGSFHIFIILLFYLYNFIGHRVEIAILKLWEMLLENNE